MLITSCKSYLKKRVRENLDSESTFFKIYQSKYTTIQIKIYNIQYLYIQYRNQNRVQMKEKSFPMDEIRKKKPYSLGGI